MPLEKSGRGVPFEARPWSVVVLAETEMQPGKRDPTEMLMKEDDAIISELLPLYIFLKMLTIFFPQLTPFTFFFF